MNCESMQDVNGTDIYVGNKVAYVAGKNSSARIAVGTVKKIYDNGDIEGPECTVDSNTHIRKYRVLKLNGNEETCQWVLDRKDMSAEGECRHELDTHNIHFDELSFCPFCGKRLIILEKVDVEVLKWKEGGLLF